MLLAISERARTFVDARPSHSWMENEISELVAKFCGITTANPEQAKFYLESTEWQIEPALQLYFEEDGSGGDGGLPLQHEVEEEPTPMNLADYDLTEDELMANIGESESMAPEDSGVNRAREAASVPAAANPSDAPAASQRRASVPASQPKDKEKGSARRSGGGRGPVMTIGDLGKRHESDSDSDGQEYYTGGEKSGMVVQDPNKKPNRRDLEAIFERVRKSGAQEGPMAEPPRPAAPRSSLFSGSSRTLNGETRHQEHVPSETGLRASPPEPLVHTVHFWRNGFTVNEGPLRRLDDPLNLPFLESINRSECPRELEPEDRSTPVNVNLVKRIDEDWLAPPEPKYVAFKGQGHTLGTNPARPEDVTSSTNTNDAPRPSQGLVIDDAKPATSIQLRLSDGTRMVARFNTTHTVADIRGFIDAARPGGTGPYQLQTMGFPPVKLTDAKQTIEGAGLLNAVVIQKA